MSKMKKKMVTLELSAGVLRWLEVASKRRGMNVDSLVEELARMEKDGGAVLDVDVIRKEDGGVKMQVFADEGSGEGKDEVEALAALRESVARGRRDWWRWRATRAMGGKVGECGRGKSVTYRALIEHGRVRINGLPEQLGKFCEDSRRRDRR